MESAEHRLRERHYQALAIFAVRRWRRCLEQRIGPVFDRRLSMQLDRVIAAEELLV